MEPGANDVRVNGGIARLLGVNCHIVMLFVYIQINENVMIYNLYGSRAYFAATWKVMAIMTSMTSRVT